MLNLEDHQDLAERCAKLARASPNPGIAKQLMAIAANYLALAELAARMRRAAAECGVFTGQSHLSHTQGGRPANFNRKAVLQDDPVRGQIHDRGSDTGAHHEDLPRARDCPGNSR
jgi:hypothetical protein